MDKLLLKELLHNVIINNCAVPDDIDPFCLSVEMMEHLGDTDSELRDELILTILMEWIMKGYLSNAETLQILLTAIDEHHILCGLGNTDDTVFLRTFSAEVVAAAINRHRTQKYLSEAELDQAFRAVLQFYNNDIDIRGYVEGKGWAHGAAHGADALDEFAGCDEIGHDGLMEILAAIHRKVNVNYYCYIHFEEERIATAVKAVFARKLLTEDEIINWMKQFTVLEKSDNYLKNMTLEINVCTFLKSLYFRLIDNTEYACISEEIKSVLKKVNRFSRY